MKLGFVFCTLFLLLLSSCGLRYTPPPTIEELQNDRRSALESQLYSDFKEVSLKPTFLHYGDPLTIKPVSFVKLDSLFNLKYIAQKSGLPTEELDREIDNQRSIVLMDTTEVLFRETVWIELTGGEKLEFIILQTDQNNQYVLRNSKILESFNADKSDSIWAVTYATERSFLRSSTGFTNDERNFYDFTKNHALELSSDDRDLYLKNVFQIMRIASEERSLSSDLILRRLAAFRLTNDHPELNPAEMVFSADKLDDGTGNFSYEVNVFSKTGNFKQIYVFDRYFYPIEAASTN